MIEGKIRRVAGKSKRAKCLSEVYANMAQPRNTAVNSFTVYNIVVDGKAETNFTLKKANRGF